MASGVRRLAAARPSLLEPHDAQIPAQDVSVTRPHKSVTDGYAALRGAWPSVASAKLPADINTLVVDGEVQDLAGMLELPELKSVELHRWARPLEPLAGHPAITSLFVDATGDFGTPAVFADMPALEMLFIGVAVQDAARIPALMNQIPWPRLRQLRHLSIGATDWENEPLATHDLGFLLELPRIEFAALGSLLSDPDRGLTRERLPASLRELQLIEREPGELDDAAARLTASGVEVMAVDIADETPGLPWPPPRRGDLNDDAIGDLIDEAVTLQETEDGWTLSVLASGLPIDGTTSELRDRLLTRIGASPSDIVIDIEGSELTILGHDLAVGERWEQTVTAIMKELWGL